MHKIRTHHRHIHGRIFSWMVLIMGLSIGMVAPVFPNFVKSIVETDSNVSMFFSAMAVAMFLGALISTLIFRKVERTKIAKLGFLIPAVILFLMIFAMELTHLSVLQAIRTWFLLFLFIALSLFIRDFANSKNLGKEEGIFYRFDNIGLCIGPLIGGFLGARYNFETVFILSAFTLIAGLLYFYHAHVIKKHPAIINRLCENKYGFFANFKKFFKDRGRTRAYLMTILLYCWFQVKALYVPLYVISLDYLPSMTGLILALGILPYILLEVKVGKFADRHGIKLPVSIGFLILGLMLILIFVSPYPLLNFGLIILANIGGALVEPLQEYVLYKHLPKKDEDELYGIYMTADPIAFFIVPAAAILLLNFFTFNYIFLFFGIVILVGGGVFFLTQKKKV